MNFCPRQNCNDLLSRSEKSAVDHILNCPTLPNEYYQCLNCPAFFVLDIQAKIHECKIQKDDADDYEKSTEDEDEISEPEEFGLTASQDLNRGTTRYCSYFV